MASGLNTQGTNISVLPQYTPSNTALDLSALGSGISQGMGLVGQFQQTRRLRDIMAEETARKPLRDIVAKRQMFDASQPLKETLYEFTDELPDGGGIGRWKLERTTDPLTGLYEDTNQFVEQIASPDEVAATQNKAQMDAMLKQAELRQKEAQTEALMREKKPPVFKGETTQIMVGGKPMLYSVTYDANGNPTLGSALGEAVPRSSAMTQDDFLTGIRTLSGSGAPTPGASATPAPTLNDINEVIGALPPASVVRSPSPATIPAVVFRMPGSAPTLSLSARGVPSFTSEAEFNTAYDAGLIKVGDRVNVAGADFDVQE